MYCFMISLSLISSLLNNAPFLENPQYPKQSAKVLQRMYEQSEGTLTMEWDETVQSPKLLAGKLTEPSAHSPGWISYAYLDSIKTLYGLKRVKDDLKIVSIEQSDDVLKVYLQRQLYNKPVCGNLLTIDLDRSGSIRRIEGSLDTGLEKQRLGRPMYPAVTKDEAMKIALSSDHSLQGSKTIHIDQCYLPSRTGVPLVYVVNYERDGLPASLMIHSITGRIIK
ncbi:hypothetical protein ACFFK0_05075 [Paenibacillus chartarius]|uniref:PepSY domain-containing protein n=1 Tax=Paenibacillus chartarius TaxID=747481 RepID=A0ABV6DGR4_9BACL